MTATPMPPSEETAAHSVPPRPADRPADAALALDEAALTRLRELDPDGRHGVLKRVLQTFETSLVRMQAQWHQACERGDAAAVGALAHTLKSSSASVGAPVLSALCAQAERAVRDDPAADLALLVRDLSAEVDRVLAAVRAMLQS